VWTITANGKTESVEARIGWEPLQLDYGPRAMGSISPVLKLDPEGNSGQHVQGIWSEPRTAAVGQPMPITLWGDEVSQRYEHDQVNTEVYLTVRWFKHQGSADAVRFDPDRMRIEGGQGSAMTSVTFAAPGEYVLRARVDNFNANDSSGGDQCCWSNAFVPVTVRPAP
jgi:hypothetical protein